ncbi:DoxX family protein [Streptomyces sp. B6B3]|jgi:putative oxidoreductase|uniref:DoxX family protein n=1 Tax=Streptomyces sp. B6B3 TaxID=3153570 RepID=UPI00325C4770
MPSTTTLAPQAPAAVAPTAHGYDLGLLLLRIAVGATIAVHGSQKLFGWFDGPGLTATGQGFEALGYPSGEAMALIAGLCETFGGLGLMLGLLTPLAAAAVLGTMINAVFAVHWDSGFFAPEGFEYPMLIGLGAASLALTGPGRYAADRLLPVAPLRAHRLEYGLGAVALSLVSAIVVLLIRN